MSLSAPVASTLATTLLLLRDQPERREAGAAAFRVFLAALGPQPLTLKLSSVGLELLGEVVPDESPGVQDLRRQLGMHGIGLVELPANLPPAAMLMVLRAMAQPRGRFRSIDHLLADIDPATRAVIRIAPSQEEADATFRERADYIPGDDIMQTLDAAGSLWGLSGMPLEVGSDKMRFAHLERVSSGRMGEVVKQLEKEPVTESAAGQLSEIVAGCDVAARSGEWDAVRNAIGGALRAEVSVPEGELKRAYGIAIRRMLTRGAIEHLAKRTTLGGAERAEAIDLLRRGGSEASEVLLGLLAESSQLDDRRGYYAALRQVATVSPLFSRLLAHEEWYVIRNVAELCGDLRAEDMVPNLARHVGHPDERVRRAVAGALARIGSSAVVEPLRHMLKDPSPLVRLQAVQGLDGARSRGLAMTLALAADEEQNPDVLREIYLALGRIGSADAVQVLSRAAQPGRKLFSRRLLATRLAAIEGLRLAGSAPAATALQALLSDGEREVREAAQDALGLMEGR